MSRHINHTAPAAGTRMARFLNNHIDGLFPLITQREIATVLGYDRPNIISMFKTGQTKVPFEKIPALAQVLSVDPTFLMQLALEQYWPDRFDILKPMFTRMMTANEQALVDQLRAEAGGEDYKLPEETLASIRELIAGTIAREKSI
jgi:hypothetical protein